MSSRRAGAGKNAIMAGSSSRRGGLATGLRRDVMIIIWRLADDSFCNVAESAHAGPDVNDTPRRLARKF